MTDKGPLRQLAPYFHQDLDVVHGSIENAVATATAELPPELRRQVFEYVSALLEESAILAKLNAECRRAGWDICFKREESARMFCNLLKRKMDTKGTN